MAGQGENPHEGCVLIGASTGRIYRRVDHSGCFGAPPTSPSESRTVQNADAKFEAALAIVRDALEQQGWHVEAQGNQLVVHDAAAFYCGTVGVSYDLRLAN